MPERSLFLKPATKFLCPYVSIYWGLVSYVYDNIPDSYTQEMWAFRLLKKQKTFPLKELTDCLEDFKQ